MKAKGHLLNESYDLYDPVACFIRTDELSREEIIELKTYADYRMLLEPSNINYVFRLRNFFGVRTKLRILSEILKHTLWKKG
jgi:hypothetical protein